MKTILTAMTIVSLFTLSGCATMNDNFSCNRTAGDTCLTIDQVNAMTEVRSHAKKSRYKAASHDESDKVWLSPWVDKNGNHHGETVIYMPNGHLGA